jgi:hypothetical protein
VLIIRYLRNCAVRCSQLCYDKVYEAKVSDKTSNLLFLNLDRILPPTREWAKKKSRGRPKRKMHQTSEKGGAWFTVNARGSHAYRVPFSAVPIREGVYHDRRRETRDPYVVFSFKDADLIELLKVNGKLN